jgi:hypothetical protein
MGRKKPIDITGQTYNRLTIVSLDHIDERGGSYWNCICSCGKKVIVRRNNLLNHSTKSCGCHKKETQRKKWLKPNGHAAKIQVYNTFKGNAKKRKLQVGVSFDEWEKIGQENCYYCGSAPSNITTSKHGSGNFTYNGLDRVDNTLGYIKDNIVPCCFICNHAKSDIELDNFITWVKKITERISNLDELNRRTNRNTKAI